MLIIGEGIECGKYARAADSRFRKEDGNAAGCQRERSRCTPASMVPYTSTPELELELPEGLRA